MPRSRGSDMPQRQCTRGSHPHRTSTSNSDPLHHRLISDRSPKLGPKGSQSDPLNQKKLGTRIAGLESQLGQAQEELRLLKQQLASAEAAKKEAQEKLQKKTKKLVSPEPEDLQENHPRAERHEFNRIDYKPQGNILDENQCETDVFEVPVAKVVEKEMEPNDSLAPSAVSETQKPSPADLASKNEEISILKSKLEEKGKAIESFGEENENLKKQLNEARAVITSSQEKESEMTVRLKQMGEELEASKTDMAKLEKKLKEMAGEKEALEAEMKTLKVHSEQWRKAADAAAAVLAGEVQMNARISDRCNSMDKHLGGAHEPSAGAYTSLVGSPGMTDDLDAGYGSAKQKGSGIRMFGELWKRKGQK